MNIIWGLSVIYMLAWWLAILVSEIKIITIEQNVTYSGTSVIRFLSNRKFQKTDIISLHGLFIFRKQPQYFATSLFRLAQSDNSCD